VSYYLGSLIVNIYDLLIFIPLWFEKKIRSRAGVDKTKLSKEIAG